MYERTIYMSDIKDTFGKLNHQSYDELSWDDKTILSMAFSSHYSDLEIRYMLEDLSECKTMATLGSKTVKHKRFTEEERITMFGKDYRKDSE